MKRAAIYTRVSTTGQAEDGTSLLTQLEACERWATQHGYAVTMKISDDVSGSTLERPGLDSVRDAAQAGELDAVIIFKLDRLSRDTANTLALLKEFTRNGVKLESATMPIEATPEGTMALTMLAAFAQFERAQIAERCRRGKMRRAREGRVLPPPGRATFGYTYNDGQYTINEEEACIVLLIYRLLLVERLSIYGIALRLNEMGVPTARGGTHWHKSPVFGILRNPTYTGLYTWNQSDSSIVRAHSLPAERRARNGKALKPEADWVEVDVPPIISRAMFEAVQARLAFNKSTQKRNTKRQYLLSSMIFCGGCGRYRLSGGVSRKKAVEHVIYSCPGRLPDQNPNKDERCKNGSYMGHKLEPLVWDAVVRLISRPEALSVGPNEAELRHMQTELAALTTHERQLERESDNLLNLLVALDPEIAQAITPAKLRERAVNIQQQREALVARRAELEARTSQQRLAEASKEMVLEIAHALRGSLARETRFEAKRKLLEQLQLRITVKGDDIMLEGLLGSVLLSGTAVARRPVQKVWKAGIPTRLRYADKVRVIASWEESRTVATKQKKSELRSARFHQ